MPIRITIRGLRETIDAVARTTNLIARQAMIGADARLVTRTPVETGRAKNNWLPSEGTPVNFSIPAPEGGGGAVEPKFESAVPESSVGEDAVVFYLSNNLTYIEELNEGKSDQAPPAYANTAVQEAAERADALKVRL